MARENNQFRSAAVIRGFTLVEILVVIVILGTISAIVIPQIGSRDDLRCAAAARVMMGDIIYAQNLAISTQRQIHVRVGTTSYSLYDSPTSSTPLTHPINKSPYTMTFGTAGTAGLTAAYIDSRSFDGSTTLVFDEMGVPYSYDTVSSTATPLAAAGEIVVGSGSYRLKVEIEPFTGEITVSKDE